MNKSKIVWIAALLNASALHAQQTELKRMAVISDVHLMAPSLLVKDGKAFQTYIDNDRKMLQESPELLDSVSRRIIAFCPQVVLITGDLTKDGEKISHELLINSYLAPLKAQGIRVFVIPGNHDVNNPHAKIYDGDSIRRTTTVSPKDFAQQYLDYGYGEALAQDRYSLSYVANWTSAHDS